MREILFRGKRKDNGEWAVGYFVYAKSDFDDENWREADIIPHDTDRVYTGEYNVAYTCDIETVGQYTGLTDKNGKMIFEGDIVKTKKYGKIIGHSNVRDFDIFVVIYEPAMFRLENTHRAFNLVGKCGKGIDYEVIGNIHDNPELLEAKS